MFVVSPLIVLREGSSRRDYYRRRDKKCPCTLLITSCSCCDCLNATAKTPVTHTSLQSVQAPVDSAPAVPLKNRYASDDQHPQQFLEKDDQEPTVRLNLSPRRPTAPAGQSAPIPGNEPSSRVKRQTATGSRWSLIGTYVPPATSWTVEARPATSPEISIAQNRELQRRVEEKLTGKRDRAVYVPAGASAYPALEVFERAIKQPEVLDRLASKSIDLTSIMIKSDSISGNLSPNGKPMTFTTSDDSGWWQVSNKIRVAAKTVDPKNNGMSYPDRDPNEPGISMIRNTVLQFYGMDKPVRDNEARITAYVLNSTGLPGPGSSTIELRTTREQRARRQVDEIDERKLLASKLEHIVKILPDETPVSLSDNFDVELSGTSPLRKKHHAAAVKLKNFLELPNVKSKLLGAGIRFPDDVTFPLVRHRSRHRKAHRDSAGKLQAGNKQTIALAGLAEPSTACSTFEQAVFCSRAVAVSSAQACRAGSTSLRPGY